MKKLGVDMNCYFNDRLAAKHADIIRMLVEKEWELFQRLQKESNVSQ